MKTAKLNDLYHALPDSWAKLKYKHYKHLVKLQMVDEAPVDVLELVDAGITDLSTFTPNIKSNIDNTALLLSTMLDVPVESLLALDSIHFLTLANRIKFIYTEPSIEGYKCSIKWKDMTTMTTNDYILFLTLANDPVNNIGAIVKSFSLNDMTDEDVDELSVLDIHSGFFLLIKQWQKYTNSQIRREQLKLLKMSGKTLVTHIRQKFRRKKGK
ncbi:MAG: hypothetical protein EOO89_14325 [Pedobacter sp.]|nr:MAG: hypothetical protein EOO89_14325 [Pedobacter sp.]